jgi:DNA invertase Pin-like site-specific DNA recombinase
MNHRSRRNATGFCGSPAYIARVGGELVDEHVEVETGRKSDRPVLAEAIAQCRRKKAMLLIARLDRLARSVSFIACLMDGGIEFRACDMPEAGRLILHIMAAFAEHEREQIAARTKAALAAAKARGVRLGAYGQVLARQNRADAEEFAGSIRPIVEDGKRRGCETLSQFAVHLNDAGSKTREGKAWSPGNVQRLLQRLDLPTPLMAKKLVA